MPSPRIRRHVVSSAQVDRFGSSGDAGVVASAFLAPAHAPLALQTTSMLRQWLDEHALLLLLCLFLAVALAISIWVRYRRIRRDLEARSESDLRNSEAQRLRRALQQQARVDEAAELAAAVSHEVNQPLTAIVANAEAARRMLSRPEIDLAEIKAILEETIDDARHASEVVRGMRSFLVRHETRTEPVDVNEVVEKAQFSQSGRLAQLGIVCRLELSQQRPVAQADPAQVQQILVNLMQNSCDALGQAPGPRHVKLSTAVHGDRVRIEVEDSGPGVSPEVRSQLFRPLVTDKPEGLGIGLSLSRRLAEAMGGTLEYVPSPHSGANFRLELPCEVGVGDASQ